MANQREEPPAEVRDGEPMRYPEGHVVGIVDTPEAAGAALRTLSAGGFLPSEITVVCGVETADRVRQSSGRTGLVDAVLRLAEGLGILNNELEEKRRYEQALRAGGLVLLVLAPTEERKQRAAELLRAQGAHFVNYMGRFTSERLVP